MADQRSVVGRSFPTTRWSLVARGRDALADLFVRYQPALRAHLVLNKGVRQGRADDLIQGFVTRMLLEKDLLGRADRAKGKFRTFLLTALDRYVANQRRDERARKRSPSEAQILPIDDHRDRAPSADPATDAFDVAWARQVLAQTLRDMEAQCRERESAPVWEVFDCRVFNRYGCREVSLIASECGEHNGLHTMAEGLYVEVIRGDQPAQPGELGAVLVTDLLNRAMPLIRYRIGDMAVPAAGPCPCGRGLPRLQSVQGRVTDFLVGTDGRLVSGAALTVLVVAKRPSLGQVQIWQDTRGRVLYKIAKREGDGLDTADREFLDRQTKLYLGQDAKIECELVEALPSEPSGKFLFCRSTAATDFVDLHA